MPNKKTIMLFSFIKNYLSIKWNMLGIFLVFFFLLASFVAAGEAIAVPLVVNSDHTISINGNGQKVFPVMMYNLCLSSVAKGGGEAKCAPSLAANNNTIFTYDISQSSYVSKYEAAQMGFSIRAGSTANKGSPYAYAAQLTADCGVDPACDEPDYSNPTIMAHVMEHVQFAKNNLPGFPIWINHFQNLLDWLQYVDIYAFDGYANAKKFDKYYSLGEDLVYANQKWLTQTVEGKKWNDSIFNNKAVWVVIGAYGTHAGFPPDPDLTVLTEKEARAMTWDSIASGAQGIAYYGWLPWGGSTPSPGVHDSPEAQYYRDIASEIRSLNNILILPTKSLFWQNDKNTADAVVAPNNLKTFGKDVWSGTQMNRFTYLLKQPTATNSFLIVVNKDISPISNVEMNVKAFASVPGTQTVKKLISGSGSWQIMSATAGKWTDNFAGYGVHIYQICAAGDRCDVPPPPPPPSYSPPPPPVSSPPPSVSPPANVTEFIYIGLGYGYFEAANGIHGGANCGTSDYPHGIKGSFTPLSACEAAYGVGSTVGSTLGTYHTDHPGSRNHTICDASIDSDFLTKIACLPPPPTPTPTSTPTPPPPAPPCAKWKDGTPDSGVCLEVATSIFQGDTKSGNISTDPGQFIIRIFTIILGFAGGIALLLIISSGYKILMSKGKPEGIQQGREQLTAALVGLVFIIFSFVIFQFVIADILKIPGIK